LGFLLFISPNFQKFLFRKTQYYFQTLTASFDAAPALRRMEHHTKIFSRNARRRSNSGVFHDENAIPSWKTLQKREH